MRDSEMILYFKEQRKNAAALSERLEYSEILILWLYQAWKRGAPHARGCARKWWTPWRKCSCQKQDIDKIVWAVWGHQSFATKNRNEENKGQAA